MSDPNEPLAARRTFLESHRPFALLNDGERQALAARLGELELPGGAGFPPRDDGATVYVLAAGNVEFRDGDRVVERLEPGDVYTARCQLIDAGSTVGSVGEAARFYTLGCDALRALCQRSREFAMHFNVAARARLRAAVVRAGGGSDVDVSTLNTAVGDVVQREPVTIEPSASIEAAARRMTENGVSALLVVEGERLAGLVTDRDMRARCVSVGLPTSRPVGEIMTVSLQTIARDASLAEALTRMTEHKLHHLPVMDGGRLVGMITSTDLARHHSARSGYLVQAVRRANNVDELVAASRRLPELQLRLADSGATAAHIGEAVSAVTDALTIRLIELAEADLGPAPVPFLWAAGGSQARREQSSHSDQDNALILSDDFRPEHDAYFAELARRVSDGLDAAGFIYCPGDAMATNPEWRQPLATWRRYFNKWIDSPQPKALMLSSIFFDLRAVHGERSLLETLQAHVAEKSRGNGIFLAFMAANALTHRPPLGIFRQFVLVHDGKHDDTLDIKHRGIAPITDLARVYALAAGLTAVNTTARIRAAGQTDALSRSGAESLEDALEFIATLRIRHQAAQIRAGRKADNYLVPETLSSFEREHLKAAFKLIKSLQETIAGRYQTGRIA